MPITTKVPVNDLRSSGGIRDAGHAALYIVYGSPHDAGVKGNVRMATTYEAGGNATVTFIAEDPSEQTALDEWAAQIDADSVGSIKKKINAAADADKARVRAEGGERRIYKMNERPTAKKRGKDAQDQTEENHRKES